MFPILLNYQLLSPIGLLHQRLLIGHERSYFFEQPISKARTFENVLAPDRILSVRLIISFITHQNYNQLLFLNIRSMATQIQIYQEFPSIHESLSDISTEGEDEIINFCQEKCFENSQRSTSSQNRKIKSSLCKNFTQKGLCPYGDKCQFAHGTHQLRCNAEVNISYKTKYCNSFLNKKCCIYGFRCNFIHRTNTPIDEQQKWNAIYSNHRETILESRKLEKSRLLTILGQSSQ